MHERARLKFDVVERETRHHPPRVSSTTESYNGEPNRNAYCDRQDAGKMGKYGFKTERNPLSPMKAEENTQHRLKKKIIPPL